MTNTKKRNLLAAGVILCALLSGIGTTMAYFTESAQETNVFTTGDLDIGLKEPEWDPKDNDGKNMYPGYTVYKNPTVKNITSDKNGEEPCYVRMIVDILDGDGADVTDSQALNLIYKTIYYDESFDGRIRQKGRNLNRVDPGPDSRLQPFRAGGIHYGESSLGKGYGKIYGV